MTLNKQRILWWGRHGNYGPDYPRNRTIMQCLTSLGCEVIEFQPKLSPLGHFEANLRHFKDIDLVWVPCFRQRDVTAAAAWSNAQRIPLVFDPLISAYDKRINEKNKYPADSLRAKKLLRWERHLFSLADRLIADTVQHKNYFADQLHYDRDRIRVIPVSAEEALFYPSAVQPTPDPEISPEILFFGTFIELQGATYIAEALSFYQGPEIKLTFLGDGPQRQQCEEIISATTNHRVSVRFEQWLKFQQLPQRIRDADICLGIFGSGEKAQRVIPNKVYQSLACGKPVITLQSAAYPMALQQQTDGIHFSPAADPQAIARTIETVVSAYQQQKLDSTAPRRIYDIYFSNDKIKTILSELLTDDFPALKPYPI